MFHWILTPNWSIIIRTCTFNCGEWYHGIVCGTDKLLKMLIIFSRSHNARNQGFIACQILLHGTDVHRLWAMACPHFFAFWKIALWATAILSVVTNLPHFIGLWGLQFLDSELINLKTKSIRLRWCLYFMHLYLFQQTLCFPMNYSDFDDWLVSIRCSELIFSCWCVPNLIASYFAQSFVILSERTL